MGEHWFDPGSSDEEEELELREAGEKKKAQSPWEFSAYSESVIDEHDRKGTTSVDTKITRLLQERPVSLPNLEEEEDDDEDEDGGDADEEGKRGGEMIEQDDEDVEVKMKSRKDKSSFKKSGKGNEQGKANFFASSEGASFSANSFLQLNLSRPLLRACEALGYRTPTPIQAACIPLALTGRDICGSAITGSGKTAAFTLPVLERLLFRPKRVHAIRVLILAPTRELAAQVHSMIEKLAQFTDIRCCLVLGGLSTKAQEVALRSLPDIVVATPGRIIDHLRNSLSVGLDDLAVLILDEADRLLEFGFSGEIQELIRLCPKRRQTMLFSATMTDEVDELIKLSLTKPVRLEADPLTKRPITLTEEVVRIRRMREVNQEAVVMALCSKTFTHKVIIFSGTKLNAHRLKIIFGLAGFKAAELHGNLTQVQRLDALELFRKQEVDFLIATDVAARGLDIVGVQTVINFACPRDITSYVHRVGRTARAGREGHAITFVTDNDRSLLKAIAKRAGSQLRSRIVAEKSILEWSRTIEKMEEQISAILQEEREERALRKAEMEAVKAENMIAHKDEIFSRPPKTWFVTEKEKKLIADAAKKKSLPGQNENEHGKLVSANQAEEMKMKEKKRREHERNLPRKKRRRLEAARETLEDNSDQENGSRDREKPGQSLVNLGYKRAKSLKASTKRGQSVKGNRKLSQTPRNRTSGNYSRKEEMQELFQNDMSEMKQARNSKKGSPIGGRKKSKSSFKSKSRFKRRK